MFVQATKDNKGGRDGYYCALVKSVIENGRSVHKVIRTFGFIPADRVPYLKACFTEKDPEVVLAKERAKLRLPSAGADDMKG